MILYATMFAVLFATTIKFLHLPQSALGTLGRITTFGVANYAAFLWLVRRYHVKRLGMFGYAGPSAESLIIAPIITLTVMLLFPLGVLAFRFGDPAVFTIIGIAVLGLLFAGLVALACGGEDWSEAAAEDRNRIRHASPHSKKGDHD